LLEACIILPKGSYTANKHSNNSKEVLTKRVKGTKTKKGRKYLKKGSKKDMSIKELQKLPLLLVFGF
jgi:hypothetical protein